MGGTAVIFFRFLSLYGPSSTSYNFSQLVSSLNTILAALTVDQNNRIITLLTLWDTESLSSSELEIYVDSGTQGVISNADSKRARIRESLDNILGIGIPPEGFMSAAKKEMQTSRGCRVVK